MRIRPTWIVFGAGFLLGAAILQAGAVAARADAHRCAYVPISAGELKLRASGVSASESMGRANTHEIHAPGCLAQCVARVYCAPAGKKLSDIDMETQVSEGEVLNCESNPDPDHNTHYASCMQPEACRALADNDSSRVAKSFKVPEGHDGDNVTWGTRFGHNDAEVPVFTLPPVHPSDHSCHVCASPVSLAGGVWSFPTCKADNDSCGTASECLDFFKEHMTAYYVVAVRHDQIRAPQDPAGPTPVGPPRAAPAQPPALPPKARPH